MNIRNGTGLICALITKLPMRFLALFFFMVCPALAQAANPSVGAATTAPSTVLQQLDKEVRDAYCRTAEGVVRVHLPATLVNPTAEILRKWEGHLTPDVRDRLRNERLGTPTATSNATSHPATDDDGLPQSVTIGLVMDNNGVLLMPFYIDPARFNEPLRITTRQGEQVQAHILGSDHSTGITVLKCEQPVGTPVKVTKIRPTEGMLLIAIWGDESRLMVWTGAGHESGVVIMPDGSVGVLRGGRFLGGPGYAKLTADLIDGGKVHRSRLGLKVGELPAREQLRLARLHIVDRPGLIVTEVIADSPADKAGVQAGDVLMAINGNDVPDLTAIAAVLAEARGRATVTLGRDDQKMEVTVNLETMDR
jgi:S1-C subfamily serine protease